MILRSLFALIIILAVAVISKAQVVISNVPGATPTGSSMLDVQSVDKGVLVPRMTTAERTGIASPAKGLLVFDNTTSTFCFSMGLVGFS